jgi:phage gp36-like protein
MATVYATRTNLQNLGLPATALTGVPTDAQDEALAAASAVADSNLRSRFTLPISSWGHDLTSAICHIAAWTILSSRGFNPDSKNDSAVRMRHDDAIRWLERVADGKATPTLIDSNPVGVLRGPRVASKTPRGW